MISVCSRVSLDLVVEPINLRSSDQICCRHEISGQAEFASKGLKGRLRKVDGFGLSEPILDTAVLAVP